MEATVRFINLEDSGVGVNVEELDPQRYGFIFSGGRTNVKHFIVRHSPTGLNWGYSGSGPADTALNMLYMVERVARTGVDVSRCYQMFKRDVVSRITDGVVIPFEDVVGYLRWVAERHPECLLEDGEESIY